MSTNDASVSSQTEEETKLTPQEIVDGFRKRREEQVGIAGKIRELEGDRSEHRLVIESLEDVSGDRKCFRLVSGVLVERTVKEVLPALRKNIEQISTALEALNEQLVAKGKELNAYREKHNIRIQGEDETRALPAPASPKSITDSPSSSRDDRHITSDF